MVLCWFTFSVGISSTQNKISAYLPSFVCLMLAVGQIMQRRGLQWIQHNHILNSLFHRKVINFCVCVCVSYCIHMYHRNDIPFHTLFHSQTLNAFGWTFVRSNEMTGKSSKHELFDRSRHFGNQSVNSNSSNIQETAPPLLLCTHSKEFFQMKVEKAWN